MNNTTTKLVKVGYIDHKMIYNCGYATVKVTKNPHIKAKKIGISRKIDL